MNKISFLLFLAPIFFAGCGRNAETPEGPPIVTTAEAEQLKQGMTPEQVIAIIGDPGKQAGSQEYLGRTITTYSWQNPDASGLTVTFEDGKMQSASPTNLMK